VSTFLWLPPRNQFRSKWNLQAPHRILGSGGVVVDANAPMASEDTSKRTGPAGPKKKIEVMDPPSPLVKYLPYAAVALVVVSLVGVIARVPAYATLAAIALLSGGAMGLGYLAWQDTHAFPPEDDGFRKVVGAATVAVVVALLGTVYLTLHPPAPAGSVTLQRAGDSAAITVGGGGNNLVARVEGNFAPDVGASAQASYVVVLARGSDTEDLEGIFERSASENPVANGNTTAAMTGEVTARRHRLTKLHGPGRYTVTLDRTHENLRPPMRVSIHAEVLPPWMILLAFAVLAVLVLVVDAGIARRNIEPTYAPALLFAMVMALYLHRFHAGSNISEGLLASFLVGLLGGGLGGEVLARITRKALG
jgi:hypothetical protein